MLCQHCGERAATELWNADGGALAVMHGFIAHWCAICVVDAQLAYARERASDIPRLEATLILLRQAASGYTPPDKEPLCDD